LVALIYIKPIYEHGEFPLLACEKCRT